MGASCSKTPKDLDAVMLSLEDANSIAEAERAAAAEEAEAKVAAAELRAKAAEDRAAMAEAKLAAHLARAESNPASPTAAALAEPAPATAAPASQETYSHRRALSRDKANSLEAETVWPPPKPAMPPRPTADVHKIGGGGSMKGNHARRSD